MAGAISIVHPLENVSKKEWALGILEGNWWRCPRHCIWMERRRNRVCNTDYARTPCVHVECEKMGERFARDCYRYGTGERDFEPGIMVNDAYTRWYDQGNNLLSIIE